MITPAMTCPWWQQYLKRRDWLVGLGCCTPCAINLALEPMAHALHGPERPGLPCAQPSWHRGLCIEWARAAWTKRAQERQAA